MRHPITICNGCSQVIEECTCHRTPIIVRLIRIAGILLFLWLLFRG